MRPRTYVGRAVLTCILLQAYSPLVCAEREHSTSDQQKEAALEFERGVKHFQDGQFEPAARAFLRADVLHPSSDTLSNALIAARKAQAHLLITEINSRAQMRKDTDPGLVAEARHALAEASQHLAHVRLSCQPEPCLRYVSGQPTQEGSFFLNPGTYRLTATHPQDPQRKTEKVVLLSAGAEYDFPLELPTKQLPPPSSPLSSSPHSPSSQEQGGSNGRTLFYTGVVTTVALAGLTTWSGLHTLSLEQELGPTAPQRDIDALTSSALRTDILLGATLGTGLFTLAWALWGVEWSSPEPPVSLSFLAGGAVLSTQGVLP